MSETQLKIFEREEFGEVRILDDGITGGYKSDYK